MHQLLVGSKQLLRPIGAGGSCGDLGPGTVLDLRFVAPAAVVAIAGATPTYWPLAITLHRSEFKTEHSSRWDVVLDPGSGNVLTLDFLARQLLQAVVMRLRFRTGASDMAVVTGWVTQAGPQDGTWC